MKAADRGRGYLEKTAELAPVNFTANWEMRSAFRISLCGGAWVGAKVILENREKEKKEKEEEEKVVPSWLSRNYSVADSREVG